MYKELTKRQYNIVIGLMLLWGFAVNLIMWVFFKDVFAAWNPRTILIGYFVLAISGILLYICSDNPALSFLGYNMLALPIGVVLSIVLKDIYIGSIINAFLITTLITIIMIFTATIEPEIFESMGKTLLICLTGVIIIEFVMLFIGIITPKWWDLIVALLFCGYIGYDWSKAQSKLKTLDNAIDSAAELYLDIINLFIRLLAASDDD